MNAVDLLVDAGWFPGRVVDAKTKAHPAGQQMLREFSGLTMRSIDRQSVFWVDGERALQEADAEWCRAYSEASGRTLVPIGGYSHMTVLVDERGGLWGGFDSEYGWLAGSVPELVRVLLVEPGSRTLDRQVPKT